MARSDQALREGVQSFETISATPPYRPTPRPRGRSGAERRCGAGVLACGFTGRPRPVWLRDWDGWPRPHGRRDAARTRRRGRPRYGRAPRIVPPEPGPPRIPTGFPPPAQGCEARATLGNPSIDPATLKGVASGRCGYAGWLRGSNSFRVGGRARGKPRVARAEQPRAEG